MTEKLVEYLSQFVMPRRLDLFDSVLDKRTRYLTIVLEDIYQSHNYSAVLRSCDCFGIQDVHFIENENEFRISPDVAMGSEKWLTIHRHNQRTENTKAVIHSLKDQGYRIVATTPHKNDCSLTEFDLSKGRTALFFGTELRGLSAEVLQLADEYVKIPMSGFTESLNISVTAALFMHNFTDRLRQDTDLDWHLTPKEKMEIKLVWLRNSIKKSELIEKLFVENQGSGKSKSS